MYCETGLHAAANGKNVAVTAHCEVFFTYFFVTAPYVLVNVLHFLGSYQNVVAVKSLNVIYFTESLDTHEF